MIDFKKYVDQGYISLNDYLYINTDSDEFIGKYRGEKESFMMIMYSFLLPPFHWTDSQHNMSFLVYDRRNNKINDLLDCKILAKFEDIEKWDEVNALVWRKKPISLQEILSQLQSESEGEGKEVR